MYEKIIFICGAPRSGTSWVGQILDSSPDTAYRYQPLFSWAFKDRLNTASTKNEYLAFFKDVYYSSDDFVRQTERKRKALYPIFKKKGDNPPILLIKMVRYHYLLPLMLKHFHSILKVVFILRHPCGVINSWLKTPKEFFADADPLTEWDKANSRNSGKPEEYWGFDGWKRTIDIYFEIKNRFPDNIYLLKYEKLVEDTIEEGKSLFDYLNITMTEQTLEFLISCHQKHNNNPYSVYKKKNVKDSWKTELDPRIKNAILEKTVRLPIDIVAL